MYILSSIKEYQSLIDAVIRQSSSTYTFKHRDLPVEFLLSIFLLLILDHEKRG